MIKRNHKFGILKITIKDRTKRLYIPFIQKNKEYSQRKSKEGLRKDDDF